jgi:hypothetical protein
MANRQPRRQRVKSPPPEESDFIWDEWTGPASAQVRFQSRWGWLTAAVGPVEAFGITGLRIGSPQPEAATPSVPARQGQTKTRSKPLRPPAKRRRAS